MAGVQKAMMLLVCGAVAVGCAAQASSKKAGPEPATAADKQATVAKQGASDKQGSAGAGAVYSGPPVLDPSRYAGMASMGYASAKAAPQVMAKIFCYCGCDVSDSHSALLDCFTSEHGMDCHICQEEAILALRLHRDGASISEIQHKIDSDFAGKYPFDSKSEALKKYEASRVTASSAGAPGLTASGAAASDADCALPDKGKKAKMKLKPGAKAGNCCGGGHEHDK